MAGQEFNYPASWLASRLITLYHGYPGDELPFIKAGQEINQSAWEAWRLITLNGYLITLHKISWILQILLHYFLLIPVQYSGIFSSLVPGQP